MVTRIPLQARVKTFPALKTRSGSTEAVITSRTTRRPLEGDQRAHARWHMVSDQARGETRGADGLLGAQGQGIGEQDAGHRAQAEGRDAEDHALLELDVPQRGQLLCDHEAYGQPGPAGVVVGVVEQPVLERRGVEHAEIPRIILYQAVSTRCPGRDLVSNVRYKVTQGETASGVRRFP